MPPLIDVLAVHAYDLGLVNSKSLSRTAVVDAITDFVAESGKVFPSTCDHGVIEQIRHWLIASEIEVLADSWNPNMEANLHDTYDSYVESGELCDLDLDVLLADEDWIGFFQSLSSLQHRDDDRPKK